MCTLNLPACHGHWRLTIASNLEQRFDNSPNDIGVAHIPRSTVFLSVFADKPGVWPVEIRAKPKVWPGVYCHLSGSHTPSKPQPPHTHMTRSIHRSHSGLKLCPYQRLYHS